MRTHDVRTTDPLERVATDIGLEIAGVAASANVLSGGSSALSWSAPNGLADGQTLIVETDGTHDFGSGPNPAHIYYPSWEDYEVDANVEASVNYELKTTTSDRAVLDQGYGLIQGRSVGRGNVPGSYLTGEVAVDEPGALNGKMLFTEVFLTYCLRIPNDVDLLDGPGNQKPAWLMLGDRGDNFNYPYPNGKEGHDLYIIGATGQGPWGSTVINGNNGSGMPKPEGWTLGGFNVDQWFCRLNESDAMLAPDDYYCSRTGTSIGTPSVRGAPSTPMDTAADRREVYQAFAWDRIKLPGYMNNVNDRQQQVHYSAPYAAFGPNAWAHIDLCDDTDESLAGKRVIAKPVTWASNRIEVVLNAGNVDIGTEGVLQIRLGNGTLLPLSLI